MLFAPLMKHGRAEITSQLEMVDGPLHSAVVGRRRNQATSRSELDAVRVSSLSRCRDTREEEERGHFHWLDTMLC